MARVTRPSAQRARRLSALRAPRDFRGDGTHARHQRAWCAGRRAGRTLVGVPGARRVPDLESLQVARAIAAPARRFDTRFFAVDRTAIAHEVGAVFGPHSNWSNSPGSRCPRRSLELPIITLTILEELEDRIEGFAPDLPSRSITSAADVSCEELI